MTTKKKICYIATLSGTIRSFFIPQLKYLRQYNYDVTVIANDTSDLATQLLPEGIRVISVDMPRGVSFKKSVSSICSLYHIFKKEKFDLIQYSTPNAAMYASLAAKLAGCRIRNYHCMGFRYLGFSGLKRAIFKQIEKMTCSFSTDIECVSKSNLKLGIEEKLFSETKAQVIYHGSTGGIDLNRFDASKAPLFREIHRKEQGYADTDVVIGFVGRITKDKGIVELMDAFNKVSNKYPSVKLALIGLLENDDMAIPQRILSEAKANPRVHFFGRLQAIEEYYPMLDILVLPSYREGFGNVVIEAEAMGVPVVVTAISGPLDTMIPGETGLTCKVMDAEDLKEKLELLICNPDLRKKYGEAARSYVAECFDSEKLNAEILKRKESLFKKYE